MEIVPSAKRLINRSFRQLLGAVVRLALRNNVNCVDFVHMVKSVYVQIAAEEFGIKGRVTNDSRISMMTGLDRKEIKRIREQNHGSEMHEDKHALKIACVLSAWHESPEYIDSEGKPRLLPLNDAQGGPNVTSLIKTHGGSIAPVTVLKELQRSNAVMCVNDGLWQVLRRDYIPNYLGDAGQPELVNPDAIAQGSSILVDHINTIFHNLYRHDQSLDERFDMRATHFSVDPNKVEEFYQFIDKEGMKFLIKVDHWLMDNDANSSNKGVRLGVGLYSIEGVNKTIKEPASCIR